MMEIREHVGLWFALRTMQLRGALHVPDPVLCVSLSLSLDLSVSPPPQPFSELDDYDHECNRKGLVSYFFAGFDVIVRFG